MKKKIFILTGEASGDKLASTVISKLVNIMIKLISFQLEDQIFLN